MISSISSWKKGLSGSPKLPREVKVNSKLTPYGCHVGFSFFPTRLVVFEAGSL